MNKSVKQLVFVLIVSDLIVSTGILTQTNCYTPEGDVLCYRLGVRLSVR